MCPDGRKVLDVRSRNFGVILLCLVATVSCFREKPTSGNKDGSSGADVAGPDGGGGTPPDAARDQTSTTPDTGTAPDGSGQMAGTACRMDSDCSTGHCSDGVCCNAACDGQCESCKEANAVGTCKAVTGTPVGPREPCDGTGMCKAACDGTNGKSCTFPDSATVCAPATCTAGKVTTASLCNGAGSCSTPTEGACPNGTCATDGTAKCASACTATSCGAGFICDPAGVCLPALAIGASCSSGSMCASGFCVDGVCCDGKCDGQCESCKVAASLGKCTPVKGAPVSPRTPCGGTAPCKGTCDGVNGKACVLPDATTVCTAAVCSGGRATTASVCNGSGACTTAATSACASNLCATDGSGKCSGSCTADSCMAGTYCDSTGTCAKTLDNGVNCSTNTQCTSGNCVDGVCCDGKCAGQCQSCKDTGSVGKCKTIKGDPVSPRAACGGTGKCKAQCNGTDAMACAFPDSATVCTAATCSAGKVTTASVCNGSGSCTTSTTNACSSNLCAADGVMCAGACTATSCGAGTYCGAGGACAPTIADGKPCSANNQCAKGNCVAGICCATTCGTCRTCATGTCTLLPVATGCMAAAGAGVCDSTGACNACTAGAACTTGINAACQTGAIECTTGAAVCKATNKSSATKCGAAASCTGGSFTDQGNCSNGACVPAAAMMCQSGMCSGAQCLACASAMSTAPTGINLSKAVPICGGTAITLTVMGGSLGAGARWAWYPNQTHTGVLGNAATLTVSPTSTTTYYVRAEGPCNTTTDATKQVTVVPEPMIPSQPQDYAVPCNSTDLVMFSCNASSGTNVKSRQWYGGGATGTGTAVPGEIDRYHAFNATTGVLTVAPQTDRYYWCTITDTCDKTVTTRRAHMMVLARDPNDSSICVMP